MPHIDLLEMPLFADIPIGEVVSLIDVLAPRQIAAGQVLLQPQQLEPDGLYVLTQGEVSIHHPQSQHAQLLAAPAIVGAEDFFLQQKPSFKVVATRLTSGFCLSPASFAKLQEQSHPALLPFLLNVVRALSQQSLAQAAAPRQQDAVAEPAHSG